MLTNRQTDREKNTQTLLKTIPPSLRGWKEIQKRSSVERQEQRGIAVHFIVTECVMAARGSSKSTEVIALGRLPFS